MEDDGRTDSPVGLEVTHLDPTPDTPGHPDSKWVWLNRRLTLRQRLWRTSSIVGLVLLALAIVLPSSRDFAQSLASRFGPQPQPPVHLVQSQDGLVSLDAVAWAPDSRRVAFIGYSQEYDPFRSYAPGVVLVYDARSGQRLSRFSPDAPIAHALGVALPPPGAPTPTPSANGFTGYVLPVIRYDSVTWSPDGLLLAIPFLLVVSRQPSQGYGGLLLVVPDGTAPRVLVLPQTSYSPPYSPLEAAIEWDLQRGVAVAGPAYVKSDSQQVFWLIAEPAVSYHWTPDGTLARTYTAPPAVGGDAFPLGAVGDPDGGATFTIWQPGRVQYDTGQYTGPFYQPGAYLWHTNIATWSPDGRFVIPSLSTGGRLAGPGVPQPDAAALTGLQLTGLPVLLAHDAALLWHLAWRTDWQVAWRPDGRVLATYGAGGLNLLQLLDCASGRQLMSVQLPYGRDAPHTNGVLNGGTSSTAAPARRCSGRRTARACCWWTQTRDRSSSTVRINCRTNPYMPIKDLAEDCRQKEKQIHDAGNPGLQTRRCFRSPFRHDSCAHPRVSLLPDSLLPRARTPTRLVDASLLCLIGCDRSDRDQWQS
jgi:hypothetical protein